MGKFSHSKADPSLEPGSLIVASESGMIDASTSGAAG